MLIKKLYKQGKWIIDNDYNYKFSTKKIIKYLDENQEFLKNEKIKINFNKHAGMDPFIKSMIENHEYTPKQALVIFGVYDYNGGVIEFDNIEDIIATIYIINKL